MDEDVTFFLILSNTKKCTFFLNGTDFTGTSMSIKHTMPLFCKGHSTRKILGIFALQHIYTKIQMLRNRKPEFPLAEGRGEDVDVTGLRQRMQKEEDSGNI